MPIPPRSMMLTRVSGAVAASLMLAACSGISNAPSARLDYQPEDFSANTHSRIFTASPQAACEAARRALLSQGYVLEERKNAQQVVGRKFFQPDTTYHVQLEFRVVCAAQHDADGKMQTAAFASALQEQYSLRRTKDSASLGVGVASLSLPLEGGHDSMVKISSRTVTSAQLYEQFFNLTARYLPTLADADSPSKSGSADSSASPP